MCDRLNDDYGYICNDCFTSLVTRVNTMPKGTPIDTVIERFFTENKATTIVDYYGVLDTMFDIPSFRKQELADMDNQDHFGL